MKERARRELESMGGEGLGVEVAKTLYAKSHPTKQTFRNFHKTVDGIMRRAADTFIALGEGKFRLVSLTVHATNTSGYEARSGETAS